MVENEIPLNTFYANSDKEFQLDFYVDTSTGLEITLDGILVSNSRYQIQYGTLGDSNGAKILFTNSISGVLVVKRVTPVERTTNYNNTVNNITASNLNNDFDRIYRIQQEQKLSTDLVDAKANKEIQDRYDADLDLRGYVASLAAGIDQVDLKLPLLSDVDIGVDSKGKFLTEIESVNGAPDRAFAFVDLALDKTDVGLANVDNTSDAEKPISTLVQAELNNLVAKDVALNEAVNALANGATKAYLTYAELDAAKLTLPTNSFAQVTNDSTIANNGLYQWNGTTLTKSTYDPLTQAKEAAQELVAALRIVANTSDLRDSQGDEVVLALTNDLDQSVASVLSDLSIKYLTNKIYQLDDSGYGQTVTDSNGSVAMAVNLDGSLCLGTSNLISTTDTGYSYAITDTSGNISFGIEDDGTLFLPTLIIPEPVDPSPVDPVVPTKNIILRRTDWVHGGTYGQSLSRGSQAVPVLTTTQPYNNLTFTTGVLKRPGQGGVLTASRPLYEERNGTSSEGETAVSTMLNSIVAADGGVSSNLVFFGHAGGQGGLDLLQLSKGTSVYNDNKLAYQSAYNLAQAANKSYSVWFIAFLQGESNYSINTTKAAYITLFDTFKTDLDTDIQAITKQDFVPIVLTYQVATHKRLNRDTVQIARAQWQLSKERIDVVMAAPTYHLDYAQLNIDGALDQLHITAESQIYLGKYFAKAGYQMLQHAEVGAPVFEPLQPESVIWQGKIIDITFNKSGLVLDNTWVAATANSGFDIWINGAVQTSAISSVTVVGDNRVRIILASAVTGAILSYARGRTSDSTSVAGRTAGARGNLRDNAGSADFYTGADNVVRYMHNYCVIFEYNQSTRSFNHE